MRVLAVCACAVILLSCSSGGDEAMPADSADVPTFAVTSDGYVDGGEIPEDFTCDGAGSRIDFILPEGPPAEARLLAWILEDLDAPGGTYVHWVVFDVPLAGGEPNVPPSERWADGVHGVNQTGARRYAPPCPPPGAAHRYVLTVYALRDPLSLEEGVTAAEVRREVASRLVARGRLIGTYART